MELVILDLLDYIDILGLCMQVEVSIVVIVSDIIFRYLFALLGNQRIHWRFLVKQDLFPSLFSFLFAVFLRVVLFLKLLEVKFYRGFH